MQACIWTHMRTLRKKQRLKTYKQKLYRRLFAVTAPARSTLQFPWAICFVTRMKPFPSIYSLPCSAWKNQSIPEWTWHSACLQTRQPERQRWLFLQRQAGRRGEAGMITVWEPRLPADALFPSVTALALCVVHVQQLSIFPFLLSNFPTFSGRGRK